MHGQSSPVMCFATLLLWCWCCERPFCAPSLQRDKFPFFAPRILVCLFSDSWNVKFIREVNEQRFSSRARSPSPVFALPVCRVNISGPMIMFLFIVSPGKESAEKRGTAWESMQRAPRSCAAGCMPVRISGDLEHNMNFVILVDFWLLLESK